MEPTVTWTPPAKPAVVSIDAQILEIRRELAIRRKHYPKYVGNGRLGAGTAEHRLAALENVEKNLRALRALEEERRK